MQWACERERMGARVSKVIGCPPFLPPVRARCVRCIRSARSMKVALPVAAGTAVLVAVVVLVSRSNGARASTGGDTPSWLDEQAASFDRVAALVVKECVLLP